MQGPLSTLWRKVPAEYSNYVMGGILALAILMLLIAKFTSRSVPVATLLHVDRWGQPTMSKFGLEPSINFVLYVNVLVISAVKGIRRKRAVLADRTEQSTELVIYNKEIEPKKFSACQPGLRFAL